MAAESAATSDMAGGTWGIVLSGVGRKSGTLSSGRLQRPTAWCGTSDDKVKPVSLGTRVGVTKTPLHINTIPSAQLDDVKNWLE